MGEYNFIGIWAFSVPVPESSYLQPQGSDYYLDYGEGNATDPANSYNVYSTPTPGAFIFQSQLNGMYIGMPAGQERVCAAIPEQINAQLLIPTTVQSDRVYTLLYLPDQVHFLCHKFRQNGYDWETSDESTPWDGNFLPSSWNFSSLLTGTGTDGFTLHYANLTGCVFTPGLDLTGIDFSGAILDGATFDQCNLTRVNFTNCSLQNASFRNAIFVGTIFNNAKLTGAKLKGNVWTNVKAIGATLDEADFTEATFTNADLTGATLNKTILNDATFEQVTFTNCDLTSVVAGGVTAISTQAQPLIFNNAKLNFPLINLGWQWMDLRNATIYDLPQPLSTAASPLQATGSMLSGLNQNSFKGVTLQHAVLDYALMDNLDLSESDLTSASLIDASLHGATLTDGKLPGANLTGTQLGILSQLFTLPSSAETALNAGQVATLAPYFTQHGITLSSNVALNTLAVNRVWQLNDAGNHMIYTIRLETQTGNTQVLNVYGSATAASMVNAYLPDAVLIGANLYGVIANGVQFYGSGARIDGSAILEEAQLNNSNLSNLNLTQAQLLGANLSGSYLFNARFNGANMAPSADGVATDLSNANLQGADFTDAQLYGANLANAAVAISTPTTGNPNQGGVYLFSLPDKGDTHTGQQYISELNAASTLFSLNPNGDAPTLQKYMTALLTNNLALLRTAFLEKHPPVTLSQTAEIETITGGSVWQIIDGAQSYTLWTDIDENGNAELYAAPSLTNTRAAFQQNDITLRWQASAALDKANQQWLIDNDSGNPQNFSLGYVRFVVILNSNVLDVYGTAVRIERLGDNDQLQVDTETCNVTVLTVTNMDGQTVCPNGTKLSTNQHTEGVTWDLKWLRASAPPSPPTCVPTDYSWCPQTQVDQEKSGGPPLTIARPYNEPSSTLKGTGVAERRGAHDRDIPG